MTVLDFKMLAIVSWLMSRARRFRKGQVYDLLDDLRIHDAVECGRIPAGYDVEVRVLAYASADCDFQLVVNDEPLILFNFRAAGDLHTNLRNAEQGLYIGDCGVEGAGFWADFLWERCAAT